MKLLCSRNLMVALTLGVFVWPGYAAAQTMGTTTGQNPTSFSSASGAASGGAAGYLPAPTPSPFNAPAVALGSDGKPMQASISTVPPLPGQPGSTLRVGQLPKEGETGADGKVVHYTMAGHERGTGHGALNGIKLPPRSFNNIETYDGQ